MTTKQLYHYYHPHGDKDDIHPYGWAVKGPGLDMYVPDKGLALSIVKFLNKETDATECLESLWLRYWDKK